jgi:hypothetical protein
MTIRKVDARTMYICICLQFEELSSHLPVSVLLRESMSPTLSGSTSEYRGFNDSIDFNRHRGLERRGFELRGSNDHRGSEHRGSQHRGSEHRGSEHRDSNKHRGFELHGSNTHFLEHRSFNIHRGSTRFNVQYRVATRAKLPFRRRAYAFVSTSLSHLILISLLSIVSGSYFTRKQSPIDLVVCYYFTIRRISVDTMAP